MKPDEIHQILIDAGHREYRVPGRDRIYLDINWDVSFGFEVKRYGTGNISRAKFDGGEISNAEAGRLLATTGTGIYYDFYDGVFHPNGCSTLLFRRVVDHWRSIIGTNEVVKRHIETPAEQNNQRRIVIKSGTVRFQEMK